MAQGRVAGIRQMSVAVGPQTFHGNEEVQPSRRPPGQTDNSCGLEVDS